MANVASAAEVSGAQAFLKYLGASTTNNLLIIAVVAWMRQESGGLKNVIGNNPFNIRSSPLQSGQRQSKNGNGKFAIFADLETGFKAAAALLLSGGNDWRGYGLVVRAAKRGDAVDFLTALALSAWDVSHYGLPDANHLLQVYASFTGLQLPPAKKPKPKPTVKPPPLLRTIQPPSFRTNYFDGFAASRFYGERHLAPADPTDL